MSNVAFKKSDMTDKNPLTIPFQESEIEWRLAQCGQSGGKFWGMAVAYITARAIMDRLDQAYGPDNWKVSYVVQGEFVLCDLSIRFGNEWITKTDGAEFTDIEPLKGGISGALKRAGSAWGMGRYLYQLEASFVQVCDKNTPGALYGQTKDKLQFYWLPPKLPAWALPASVASSRPVATPRPVATEAPKIPTPLGGEVIKATRDSLGAEIIKMSRLLNLTNTAAQQWGYDITGVTTDKMSIAQMQMFLEVLQTEAGRNGYTK